MDEVEQFGIGSGIGGGNGAVVVAANGAWRSSTYHDLDKWQEAGQTAGRGNVKGKGLGYGRGSGRGDEKGRPHHGCTGAGTNRLDSDEYGKCYGNGTNLDPCDYRFDAPFVLQRKGAFVTLWGKTYTIDWWIEYGMRGLATKYDGVEFTQLERQFYMAELAYWRECYAVEDRAELELSKRKRSKQPGKLRMLLSRWLCRQSWYPVVAATLLGV